MQGDSQMFSLLDFNSLVSEIQYATVFVVGYRPVKKLNFNSLVSEIQYATFKTSRDG